MVMAVMVFPIPYLVLENGQQSLPEEGLEPTLWQWWNMFGGSHFLFIVSREDKLGPQYFSAQLGLEQLGQLIYLEYAGSILPTFAPIFFLTVLTLAAHPEFLSWEFEN